MHINYRMTAYVLFLIDKQACYYPQRQANFRLFCIPQPRNDYSYVSTKILYISYTFYLLKVTDLLDTVFFILRKKNSQVTFLHIYHHAMMVFAGYLYCKLYSGGGYATVLGEIIRRNQAFIDDDYFQAFSTASCTS